jgi:hypothetical protein
MKIEHDIPIPKRIRGRNPKYDFQAMEIGHSFFTPGGSSIQVSILTCAKRHRPKRFVTKMVTEKNKKGYRCWRTV